MHDREKVIKGLEHCIEKLDTVVNKAHGFNCTTCPYFRKCDGSGYLIGLPLMRDVLALLKAQEPQLVIRSQDYIEGTVLRCPKCEEVVHKYNGNYCSYCGQAVKWE